MYCETKVVNVLVPINYYKMLAIFIDQNTLSIFFFSILISLSIEYPRGKRQEATKKKCETRKQMKAGLIFFSIFFFFFLHIQFSRLYSCHALMSDDFFFIFIQMCVKHAIAVCNVGDMSEKRKAATHSTAVCR